MPKPIFLNFEECLKINRGYLVTVNVQHLYESQRSNAVRHAVFGDPEARHCLDGRGAHLLFRMHLKMKLPLVVGNELLGRKLHQLGAARVLVVGTTAEVMKKASRRFARIQFVHEPSSVPDLEQDRASRVAAEIFTRFGSDFSLVAVALGVPKQELLASALSRHLSNVPIMCIGGSFEMLGGVFRRAPRIMQVVGLEGLWRFAVQPSSARLLRLGMTYWYFLRFFFSAKKIMALVSRGK